MVNSGPCRGCIFASSPAYTLKNDAKMIQTEAAKEGPESMITNYAVGTQYISTPMDPMAAVRLHGSGKLPPCSPQFWGSICLARHICSSAGIRSHLKYFSSSPSSKLCPRYSQLPKTEGSPWSHHLQTGEMLISFICPPCDFRLSCSELPNCRSSEVRRSPVPAVISRGKLESFTKLNWGHKRG